MIANGASSVDAHRQVVTMSSFLDVALQRVAARVCFAPLLSQKAAANDCECIVFFGMS